MPLRTHAEGVVWVPENAEVRAAADGFVERLLVRPDAGQRRRPAAEHGRSDARRRRRTGPGTRAQLEVKYASLMFDERAQAAAVREDLARERVALERAEEKLDSLLVIAAVPGVAQAGTRPGSAGALREQGRTAGLHPLRAAAPGARGGDAGRHRAGSRTACRGAGQDRRPARTDLAGARSFARCPAVTTSCRARRCRSPAVVPHGTDPRDPEGLKSLQRVFQFDLELPAAVGPVDRDTRLRALPSPRRAAGRAVGTPPATTLSGALQCLGRCSTTGRSMSSPAASTRNGATSRTVASIASSAACMAAGHKSARRGAAPAAPLCRARRGARRCLDQLDEEPAAARVGGARRAGGRRTRRRAGRRVLRPDP
jgi:hypothetical protein